MRIVKHGHACVRLENEGSAVVLDPGAFTEADAVDGVDAVLLTHEHADHYDVERLRRADAPIHTHASLADQIAAEAPDLAERTHVVTSGEEREVAGMHVRAVGEWHAVIHDELPRVHNTGFVVTAGGLSAYHPGDSFTVPGQAVDVLLLPATAPWSKVSETIDFARAVAAPRTLAIHEAIFSEVGRGVIDGHLRRFLHALGLDYQRIDAGAELPG